MLPRDLKRKPGWTSLLFAVFMALTACEINAPAPALRLGTNVWPGYEPLYLARSLGYFNAEHIHLVEYSSASQVSRAFRNDLIDAAALTLDEVMLLAQYNFEPEVILVMDVSHGGDVIMSVPDYQDLEALQDRRVGVENTALGAYLLTRALQQANMVMDDISLVPMEVDEHERAWRAGDVDAVVTFEPVRSKLASLGAVEVFDSSMIENEIVDVLVVRRNYLQQSPAVAKELIAAWYKALAYMSANRPDAMTRIAERLHISPDETLESYDGLILPDKAMNKRLLLDSGRTPASLPITAAKMQDIMLERGLLRQEVEVPGLFAYIQQHPSLHD